MANSYLQRTPSAGNRKTWTWSCWVKRSDITNRQDFFSAGTASNNTDTMAIRFDSGGNLTLAMWSADIFQTTQLFRDSGAWYHIVVSMDTTQSTASDRVKLYVNGSQVTDFNSISYPSQNADLGINGNVSHNIGRLEFNDSFYFDGYFAHVHFIDGTAYDASSFGQTNSTTGIWGPKLAPSVTYGTNGFFLKFETLGTIGNDSSGNGNNWTANGNLELGYSTPTNTFCNPSELDANGTQTTGAIQKNNLRLNTTGGLGDVVSRGQLAVSTGKWYYECKSVISAGHGNRKMIGWLSTDSRVQAPRTLSALSWVGVAVDLQNGDVYRNASGASNVGAFSSGDILQVWMDLDNGLMYLGKNGSILNSGNPVSAALDSGVFYAPCYNQDGGGSNNGVIDVNHGDGTFGGTPVSTPNADANGYGQFEYNPVLSGTNYYALCTKNMEQY